MSFQEQVDPLVKNLQIAIDTLRSDIRRDEFEKTLEKIDEKFPFVDMSEFLKMYVDGEYSKMLIEKFHLSGYDEYYKLLQILKLPKKRKSTQKTVQSREINLQDVKLAKRYKFLQQILEKFHQPIKDKIIHNVLRSIIILYLYSDTHDFTTKETLVRSIPKAIRDFEHLILAPHTSLLTISDADITTMIDSILSNLQEEHFLKKSDSDKFKLEDYWLKIPEYIINIIHNREGITHQDLTAIIKKNIPILSQVPPSLLHIIMYDLISNSKIVKKDGYWKFRPYYDEYFTFDYHKNLILEKSNPHQKNTKFYGRKITPDEFIRELIYLEKGDFEDQDDQVTRIAGMILASAPMMAHPPNDLKEFDFMIDLTNYKFTPEQQKIISSLNIKIKSDRIYIKVMINEEVTIEKLSVLTLKLQQRGLHEQGFVIYFEYVGGLLEKMLQNNETIQLISDNKLREWCKITPIIPSRRGSVAIVRQGDRKGDIVKIKSVNYESGMADVVFLSDLIEETLYVGILEEIALASSMERFIDNSDQYFAFLIKLYKISTDESFRSTIVDNSMGFSRMKETPKIEIASDSNITCNFYGYTKSKIDLDDHPDKCTLIYSADDLFSCTCFQWAHQSKTHGLCEHLIFILNESVKSLLLSDTAQTECQLEKIEQKMDLFLNRMRYSNPDGSYVVCPHCDKTARILDEVINMFGYRQMNKNDKFSLRPQSRCTKCRRICTNS